MTMQTDCCGRPGKLAKNEMALTPLKLYFNVLTDFFKGFVLHKLGGFLGRLLRRV